MDNNKHDKMLANFRFKHLRDSLQIVSMPFHNHAVTLAQQAPDAEQTGVALQLLLMAKDAAVRAQIEQDDINKQNEANNNDS